MKYTKSKKLLSSFLLIALAVLVSSTPAFATSEVTGTLSSSSTPTTTPNSGGSGSSSGGGGATSTRTDAPSVLGASTGPSSVPATSKTAPSKNLSSDGTSLKTDPGLAVDYGTVPDPSVDDTTSTYSGNQTASVAGVTSMSAATWFWIILLILILVGAIIYIYNRNKRNV
jgi:cobalamin biosynthesis Mg chelatase CobN